MKHRATFVLGQLSGAATVGTWWLAFGFGSLDPASGWFALWLVAGCWSAFTLGIWIQFGMDVLAQEQLS